MLVHNAVAAALSHQHHLIIHVGAGPIQFFFGSTFKMQLATNATLEQIYVRPSFGRRVYVCAMAGVCHHQCTRLWTHPLQSVAKCRASLDKLVLNDSVQTHDHNIIISRMYFHTSSFIFLRRRVLSLGSLNHKNSILKRNKSCSWLCHESSNQQIPWLCPLGTPSLQVTGFCRSSPVGKTIIL